MSKRERFIGMGVLAMGMLGLFGMVLPPQECGRRVLRMQFSEALEGRVAVDSVMAEIRRIPDVPEPVRRVYLGALQTLKARDASFPLTKLKWLRRGLHTMEEARQQAPDDLEVHFVEGIVWYELPPILGYRARAEERLKEIAGRLTTYTPDCDPTFPGAIRTYLKQAGMAFSEQP